MKNSSHRAESAGVDDDDDFCRVFSSRFRENITRDQGLKEEEERKKEQKKETRKKKTQMGGCGLLRRFEDSMKLIRISVGAVKSKLV